MSSSINSWQLRVELPGAVCRVGAMLLSLSSGCVYDVDPSRLPRLPTAQSSLVTACSSGADEVHWVRELDTLELHIDCDASVVPEPLLPAELPPGADYDPSLGKLVFTPGLDQAGLHEIVFQSEAKDVQHVVKVGIVDRWEHPDDIPVDPMRYTMEYGLPVIHVFADPGINPIEHTPARIVYMGREYTGAMAKYRGASSLSYAKKSFTLKFEKDDELVDTARNRSERRLVLTTTFDDTSQLRQRLAFELWNRMDPDHIQIAAYHAVLFLNGRYHGLYLATDHVDDELMKENGLWDGGNLYKARTHDGNFRLTTREGGHKSPIYVGYTKEEGSPPEGTEGAFADLEELIRFVAEASPDEVYDQVASRLRWEDFADWFIFTSALYANDSAAKNSYLYHDPRPGAPDARFRYIPWDFNASFGQDWQARRLRPDIDPEALRQKNGMFDRMLDDPRLRDLLLARYRAALEGPLELDSVLALVETWAERYRAAAQSDDARWAIEVDKHRTQAGAPLVSYDEDLRYLAEWITSRWSMLADYTAGVEPN